MLHADHDLRDESDFRLDDVLRHALAIGVVLVLLLPAARGFSQTLGWLPLWLLAMPAVALWALRGFSLPGRRVEMDDAEATAARRRRTRPQARRRVRPGTRAGLSRAA